MEPGWEQCPQTRSSWSECCAFGDGRNYRPYSEREYCAEDNGKDQDGTHGRTEARGEEECLCFSSIGIEGVKRKWGFASEVQRKFEQVL